MHLLAVRSGTICVADLVTVGEWYERWRATAQGRPSTLARDDSYLRTHFLPAFGDRLIDQITTWELQEWVTTLRDRLAPASIHKVHIAASKVFVAALAAQAIGANPARGVRLAPVPDVEARFLTLDEIAALDHALRRHAPEWCEVVPLLCDTGLRIGELAALDVGDVDLDNGVIRVRQGLVEVRGEIQIGPPKSRHARRTVPMLTDTTSALLAARIDQNRLGPSDALFSGPRDGRLRPGLFRRRVFAPAVEHAGLAGRVTPHTLRHTAISLWIACGVHDPFKLSRWAGHRDPTLIYRTYGHLLPEDTGSYRARLEGLRTGRPHAAIRDP